MEFLIAIKNFLIGLWGKVNLTSQENKTSNEPPKNTLPPDNHSPSQNSVNTAATDAPESKEDPKPQPEPPKAQEVPNGGEYEALWESVKITQSLAWYLKIIRNNEPHYRNASDLCHVPWEVIAVIHMLEAGGNMKCQILNGEPWDRKTKLVPKNKGPFKSFMDSTVFAFKMKGTREVWDIKNTLYYLERHNGFGYRKYRPEVSSPVNGLSATPYLWCFTNHYVKGKYVADGKFDPEAVSKQAGAAALLKALEYKGA